MVFRRNLETLLIFRSFLYQGHFFEGAPALRGGIPRLVWFPQGRYPCYFYLGDQLCEEPYLPL